ncbi:hypothetical protein [Chryseobacterium sp. Alg-005]|uniref:hypothetical protein n=1 Tax=Chryseobacterium sp. Alg-005 TaxID=3159516 RepID=UPI0036F3AE28
MKKLNYLLTGTFFLFVLFLNSCSSENDFEEGITVDDAMKTMSKTDARNYFSSVISYPEKYGFKLDSISEKSGLKFYSSKLGEHITVPKTFYSNKNSESSKQPSDTFILNSYECIGAPNVGGYNYLFHEENLASGSGIVLGVRLDNNVAAYYPSGQQVANSAGKVIGTNIKIEAKLEAAIELADYAQSTPINDLTFF